MLKRKWSETNETNDIIANQPEKKQKTLTIIDLLPIIYCKQYHELAIKIIPELETKWQYCFDSLDQCHDKQMYLIRTISGLGATESRSTVYCLWHFLFKNHAYQKQMVSLLEFCFSIDKYQTLGIEIVYRLVEIQNQKYALEYFKNQYFYFLQTLFHGVVDLNVISIIQEYLVGTFRIYKKIKSHTKSSLKLTLLYLVNSQSFSIDVIFDLGSQYIEFCIQKKYKQISYYRYNKYDIIHLLRKYIQQILLDNSTFTHTWLYHKDTILDQINSIHHE